MQIKIYNCSAVAENISECADNDIINSLNIFFRIYILFIYILV